MNIPEDVIESAKHSYAHKGWEGVEKPLAEQFLQPMRNSAEWVEKSLQMVNRLYRTRVGRQEITEAAPGIARVPIIGDPSDDTALSQQIHTVASSFTKYKYRLSLASKFLHFCHPIFVPPFDKYAYTALCFSEAGRKGGLRWDNHPRSSKEIETWLLAFRYFHKQHESLCGRIRGEIIKSIIPSKASALAERAITPLKVCDTILWMWGGGGSDA
ncbi:MAG: hypothetical protein HY473_02180 [Candidatus Sungbacteria bacterium]|uniref:Uncharacterized protein n=1 Tax=Candidatus Sungiibacteriota bacterium TaxID=2750080 RepID=A0A933DUC8_9BACT|nr:hypothetical protein [Candidatus Sungbacteria bacterium]